MVPRGWEGAAIGKTLLKKIFFSRTNKAISIKLNANNP
jgi:hypothetical protein